MSNRPNRKPKPPPAPLTSPDLFGAAKSNEERLRLAAYVLRDDHGVTLDKRMLSVSMALEMRRQVERGEGEVALEVRCVSTYRGQQCGQALARIWVVRDDRWVIGDDNHLHYIRWQHRTSPQWRELVLLHAMDQQEHGMPNVAKATEQQAEEESFWSDGVLEAPSATSEEFLLVCSRHGHVNMDQWLLVSEARSTRRALSVDVASAVVT